MCNTQNYTLHKGHIKIIFLNGYYCVYHQWTDFEPTFLKVGKFIDTSSSIRVTFRQKQDKPEKSSNFYKKK